MLIFFLKGAFCGCIVATMINLWIAIGSQMYGSPPATLPPAPTYACADNTSEVMNATRKTEYTLSTSTIVPTSSVSPHTHVRYVPDFLFGISVL